VTHEATSKIKRSGCITSIHAALAFSAKATRIAHATCTFHESEVNLADVSRQRTRRRAILSALPHRLSPTASFLFGFAHRDERKRRSSPYHHHSSVRVNSQFFSRPFHAANARSTPMQGDVRISPAVARGSTIPLLFVSYFRIACVVPTVSGTPTSIVPFRFGKYMPTYSSVDVPRSTMSVCLCATTSASLVPSTHHSSRERIRSSPPASSLSHHRTHTSSTSGLWGDSHIISSLRVHRGKTSHPCRVTAVWATRHSSSLHRHDYAPAHTVSFRLVFNAHR
jgi:hypothetical protein